MIDISNKTEEDFLIIKLEGEVDASSSIYLDKALRKAVEQNFKKILVDCNKLNYISSAGYPTEQVTVKEIKKKYGMRV